MTNQQILEKAIQKAIDAGWKAPSLLIALYADASRNPFFSLKGQNVEMIRGMITSHDFARALFGNEMISMEYPMCKHSKPAWRHHLQQMVIADDPIKYLGEHLNDSSSS